MLRHLSGLLTWLLVLYNAQEAKKRNKANFYDDSKLKVSKKEEPFNAIQKPTSEGTESLLQIIHRIAVRNTVRINQNPTVQEPSTVQESSTVQEPSSGKNFNEESARYLEPAIWN